MNSRKDRSIIDRIKRLVLFGLAGILFLVLLGAVLFYINKDEIGKRILESTRELQPGYVTISDMHLAPFSHFPSVSVRLDNLVYFESEDEKDNEEAIPIAEIDHFYIALDIMQLIRGEIHVSEITLMDGQVNFIVYPDSTVNVMNALGMTGPTSKDTVSMDPEDTEIQINLTDISFKNIKVLFDHRPAKFSAGLKIDKSSANLIYADNRTQLDLNGNFTIEKITSENRQFISEKQLRLAVDFDFDENTGKGEITKGDLVFEGLTFKVSGSYDTSQDGLVDLDLDASDEDLTLLSLFIEDKIIDLNPNLLEDGDLYVRGSIKGKTIKHFPLFDFSFGAKNLTINMPEGIEPIRDLEFSGHFTSGEKSDLSQAVVEVQKAHAIVNGGQIDGAFKITDFKNPIVFIDWDSQMDLTGIDEAFKLGDIDSLGGVLSLKMHANGALHVEGDIAFVDSTRAEISFKDVTFAFTGMDLPIQGLSGTIRQDNRSIHFDSISAQSGANSILIQGHMQNLTHDLFVGEHDLKGRFEIQAQSESIRSILPNWIFLPRHSLFDDPLRHFILDMSFGSNLRELRDFNYFPPGQLAIHHLEAEYENLPDIRRVEGSMEFHDDSVGIEISVNNFNVDLPLGAVSLVGNIRIDTSHTISISTDLDLQRIQFSKLLAQVEAGNAREVLADTTKNVENLLDAKLRVNTDFVHTPLRSANVSISNFDLHFIDPDVDSITIKNILIDFQKMSFQQIDSIAYPQVQSILGNIAFDEFHSTYFFERDVTCNLEGNSQQLTLTIESKDNSVGVMNEASLFIDISGDQPSYNFTYKLDSISLDEIARQYYEGNAMKGAINFSTKLSTAGSTWDSMAQNAVGNLLIEGKDLTLYGFDLDEILANYKKSQRFRLTDVGAFFVVGPFGLLITKGADFARINNINPEDSTVVTHLFSSWSLKDQIISVKDVALTTNQSRIALKGGLDIANEQFDSLTFAVLDKRGCSLLDQSINGNFKDPEMGNVNVVGTLFGAVTNVFKLVAGNRCEPFYTGKIEHPTK